MSGGSAQGSGASVPEQALVSDQAAERLDPSGFHPSRNDEIDFDDTLDDQCWNCSGDGFVSDCFEEYACMYPEDGCDLCTRRCDVCNPRPSDSDGSGEAGETGTGSTEGDSAGLQGIAQISPNPKD